MHYLCFVIYNTITLNLLILEQIEEDLGRDEALMIYRSIKSELHNLIEESNNPKINPFLGTHRNGTALANFQILENCRKQISAFDDLINEYLSPNKRNQTYLQYLLCSNYPTVFTIDGKGPARLSYIIVEVNM